MVAYRVFCLDGRGKFTATDNIEADTDETALSIARGLDYGVACEVWDQARYVGRLEAPSDIEDWRTA